MTNKLGLFLRKRKWRIVIYVFRTCLLIFLSMIILIVENWEKRPVCGEILAFAQPEVVSSPSSTSQEELVVQSIPDISGPGSGMSGNTVMASTISVHNNSITYEGCYNKDYTPSIEINGHIYIPDMAWDHVARKDRWSYRYTIEPGDKVVEAKVFFHTRKLVSITTKDAVLSADDKANTSIEKLKEWLDNSHRVEAVYDNKVVEITPASYSTTDHFEAKGKAYSFTAALGSKTVEIILNVKPVSSNDVAANDLSVNSSDTNTPAAMLQLSVSSIEALNENDRIHGMGRKSMLRGFYREQTKVKCLCYLSAMTMIVAGLIGIKLK